MSRLHLWRVVLAAWLLALWEILPRLGVLDPLFIPPPTEIARTLVELWRSASLGAHLATSTSRAFGGLALGVAIGPVVGAALAGPFRRIEAVTGPLIGLAAQANPVVLFHVFILFLGVGEVLKIAVIAWLAVWPIAFGVAAGIRSVDPDLVRVARGFGLSRIEVLLRVIVPWAAPSLFTGVRLAAGYSFIMLTAAEMMGASSGLGWFVIQSQQSFHAGRIFAGVVLLGGLSLVTDLALATLERRAIPWRAMYGEERPLLGSPR